MSRKSSPATNAAPPEPVPPAPLAPVGRSIGNSEGAIVGTWKLVRLLGQGSWCQVYQTRPVAAPDGSPADYAIKILKAEHETDRLAISMLGQEVRVGKVVNHRNVLPILASQLVSPPYFVVMPYVRSVTLRVVLDQQGRLALPQALWFARQACEALQAVHQAGWIHGDIKPSNFLIQAQGRLELFDFGLARPQSSDNTAVSELRLLGTPIYAAPELLLDTEATTAAADLYSLGVVLFEMVTGQVPFPPTSPRELAAAHLQTPPPDARRLLPGIPPRLHWLLRELLAKSPARRPDAESVLTRLVELEIETFDLDQSVPHSEVAMVLRS